MNRFFHSLHEQNLKMNPNSNKMSGAQSGKRFQVGQQGPNWILIAGGALLSTISVRIGYRLKQVLDTKQPQHTTNGLKENGKHTARKSAGNCRSRSHSNLYCFEQDDSCFNCNSGNEGDTSIKPQQNGQLPLVTVSAPFHYSNSSDSPCVSESGSDIFSKREVIQKLRQQLKRRDDMILEMQDQIAELQNSVTSQQNLLEGANRDLFDSEREIQRLRKVIADICVGQPNGFLDTENPLEKGRTESDKIEVLKREVGELKELMGGKDYLLQNYKEQKSELALKIKELQNRLDNQLPNIF